jgi:tetratricopeptide (TPR) repeat protein
VIELGEETKVREGWSFTARRETLGLGILVLSIALLLFPVAVTAQDLPEVEEEDLPEGDLADLLALVEEAEAYFASQDQPQSIPLFTQIIDTLERTADLLSGEEKDLLVRCLSRRAQAHFNLAENERAEADLQRLLRLRPGYELDRSMVSPKLLRLFDGLKNRMVGYLELVVIPADARVRVADRVVDPYAGPR